MRTNPIDTTARLAGLLYLMTVPLGVFGALYVPATLNVPRDAAATANNIIASEALFRLAILSNLLAPIILTLVVLVLYKLFKPVDQNVALLMVIFLLLGAASAMLNELNNLAVLLLLSGADFLHGFTADQLHGLVLLFLRVHTQGTNIAFIFWGPLASSPRLSGFQVGFRSPNSGRPVNGRLLWLCH